MTVTARSREIAKGLAASAVLAGLVVGLPVVLVVLVGWPLPTPASMPSWAEIQLALAGGSPPPTAVLNTVAIGLWIVWARLCAAVGTEAVRLARSRPAADLPAARRLAARLLAAAALLAPTGQTAARTGLKAASATASAVAAHQPTATAARTPTPDASTTPSNSAATPAGQQHPELGQQLYATERGDSLWSLAEDHLGDGNRWTEIDNANVGRRVEPGTRYTAETHKQGLQPGWQLVVPADAEPPAVTDSAGSTDEDEHAPTAQQPGREIVDRGEHFWSIAENALAEAWGRPPLNHETRRYWQQVVHANEARLAPPHDPDMIYPDQQFELPPVPADPTPGGRVDTEPHDTESRQKGEAGPADARGGGNDAEAASGQSGDADGEAAEVATASPTPSESRSPVAAAGGGPAAGGQPAHPRSGVGGPAGPAEGPQRVPAEPVGQSDDAGAGSESDGEVAEADGSGVPTPAVVLGGGLAAAGFLALLDRLRRQWMRRRPSGTQPPTPSRQALQVEARLRAGADPEDDRFLAAALDDLQVGLAGRPGADIPAVKGAVLDGGGLAVLVEPADPHPPEGWFAKDNGAVWQLGRPNELAELDTDHAPAAALLPALVGVGHNGQGSRVLFNLEYLGVVSLQGTHAEVVGAMHTMAIELAASPAATSLEVVCVGFGAGLALERIRAVDDVDEVAGLLDEDARHAAEMVAGQPGGPLAGRVGGDVADAWTPTVVFDPTGDSRTVAAATAAGQVGPVAVIAGGADGADAWELHLDADRVHIPAMDDLALTWPTLTGGQRDAIGELLELAANGDPEPAAPNLLATPAAGENTSAPITEQADQDTDEPASEEPLVPTGPAVVSDNSHSDRHTAGRPADHDEAVAADPAVDVRVLGPVRIDGLAGTFDYQEKAQELICYLALNRHAGGIAADTLMERLWPADHEAASTKKQRLQRVASDARRALGSTDDGRRLLPKAGNNGRYRLLDQVGCDLTRFHDHHQAADGAPPNEAIQHLQAALALVEGEPFGNVTGYSWATAESQDAQLAADQAARELASLYFDRDDLAGVRWATRQGLKALPGVQELYRLRMHAAAAGGNLRELDGVREELQAVLETDAYAPGGSMNLEPDTKQLYDRLRRQITGQADSPPAEPDPHRTDPLVESIVDETTN